MAPVADVGADGFPGFVDLHGHSARDEIGRGGKADGTSADHDDRKLIHRGILRSCWNHGIMRQIKNRSGGLPG